MLVNCIQGLVRLLRKHHGKKRLNPEQQQRTRTGKMKGDSGIWSGRPGYWGLLSRDPRRIRLVTIPVPTIVLSPSSSEWMRADASRAKLGHHFVTRGQLSLPFCNKTYVCECWVLPNWA